MGSSDERMSTKMGKREESCSGLAPIGWPTGAELGHKGDGEVEEKGL